MHLTAATMVHVHIHAIMDITSMAVDVKSTMSTTAVHMAGHVMSPMPTTPAMAHRAALAAIAVFMNTTAVARPMTATTAAATVAPAMSPMPTIGATVRRAVLPAIQVTPMRGDGVIWHARREQRAPTAPHVQTVINHAEMM